MGLFFKKTKPDEELEREGLRGKATVLHVLMPRGGMSAGLSMDKAEEIFRGTSPRSGARSGCAWRSPGARRTSWTRS